MLMAAIRPPTRTKQKTLLRPASWRPHEADRAVDQAGLDAEASSQCDPRHGRGSVQALSSSG
jgi:hypothetical protein